MDWERYLVFLAYPLVVLVLLIAGMHLIARGKRSVSVVFAGLGVRVELSSKTTPDPDPDSPKEVRNVK